MCFPLYFSRFCLGILICLVKLLVFCNVPWGNLIFLAKSVFDWGPATKRKILSLLYCLSGHELFPVAPRPQATQLGAVQILFTEEPAYDVEIGLPLEASLGPPRASMSPLRVLGAHGLKMV